MPLARQEPQINIRLLLRAHAEWIIHLREYVYGSGSLDVRVTMRDDQCDLGRWIYGEAARYRHLPEYEAARQAHAVFHAEAAQVVQMMKAGRRHEAALATGHGGRLRNQSAAMVRSFIRLSQRLTSGSRAEMAKSPNDADRDSARRISTLACPPPRG